MAISMCHFFCLSTSYFLFAYFLKVQLLGHSQKIASCYFLLNYAVFFAPPITFPLFFLYLIFLLSLFTVIKGAECLLRVRLSAHSRLPSRTLRFALSTATSKNLIIIRRTHLWNATTWSPASGVSTYGFSDYLIKAQIFDHSCCLLSAFISIYKKLNGFFRERKK